MAFGAANGSPAEELRGAWGKGDTTFGGWATIGHGYSVEILGSSGFDWIGLDLQHGLIGTGDLPAMLQALAIRRTPSLVRVAWNAPEQIMYVLDAGADGVVVPMVNSAEEAAAAAAACRYPPAGMRSWGPARPPLLMDDYNVDSGNSVICAVMVETVAAVESIDAIVATPGVDAIMIGPADLALSYGNELADLDRDEALSAAVQRVQRACSESGVVSGIFAGGSKSGRTWAGRGFQLVALMSDSALLRRGARDLARAVAGEDGAS